MNMACFLSNPNFGQKTGIRGILPLAIGLVMSTVVAFNGHTYGFIPN